MKSSIVKPVSAGDKALYQQLTGKRITAIFSSTNAGTGWRPVCNGRYLGNQCTTSERAAIEYGKSVFLSLKSRVATPVKKRRSRKQ